MIYVAQQTPFFDIPTSFSEASTEISTEKIKLVAEGCRLDTDNQRRLRNFPSLLPTMEKQHFLCMDVDFEGQADVIKEGESRKGILTFVNEDKFRFVEQGASKPAASKQPNKRPDLQWHPLAGSLHGKVSVNANGSMLMLYHRHEEYNTDARQLADLIVSEAEQIGDALADINLEEEVAKCGK